VEIEFCEFCMSEIFTVFFSTLPTVVMRRNTTQVKLFSTAAYDGIRYTFASVVYMNYQFVTVDVTTPVNIEIVIRSQKMKNEK
jgi:hypothetical protein